MIQNPEAQVFNMFPIPLYVTTYKGDTSEIVKYFNSQEMNPAHGGGYGEISKNSYIIDDPICKPLSQNKTFIMYEVPEETQPQINKFAIVRSNVNSSVYGEMQNKKAPTQNPIHIGQ